MWLIGGGGGGGYNYYREWFNKAFTESPFAGPEEEAFVH